MSTNATAADDHAALLEDLGFPPAVIRESVSALEAGLFSMEPSPGLLARTQERCRSLLGAPGGTGGASGGVAVVPDA